MAPLADFQRALAELAASPKLCLEARSNADAFLAAYVLSAREQRRLRSIVAQEGVLTNCSLYRANRVTPIYRLLPRTCFLLGDRLRPQLESFWQGYIGYDLQFPSEIGAFVAFLKENLRHGNLHDPYVAEVADFEVALALQRYGAPQRAGDGAVTTVRFRHDPLVVLRHLSVPQRPPDDLPEGDFIVPLTAELAAPPP